MSDPSQKIRGRMRSLADIRAWHVKRIEALTDTLSHVSTLPADVENDEELREALEFHRAAVDALSFPPSQTIREALKSLVRREVLASVQVDDVEAALTPVVERLCKDSRELHIRVLEQKHRAFEAYNLKRADAAETRASQA